MNEFINNDVKVLIEHINDIASHRGIPHYVSADVDFINHKSKGVIELVYKYYLHMGKEEPKIIFTFSIKAGYDQYLDDKENMIHWANYYFYNDILLRTSFEPELNNENEKYKWN